MEDGQIDSAESLMAGQKAALNAFTTESLTFNKR